MNEFEQLLAASLVMWNKKVLRYTKTIMFLVEGLKINALQLFKLDFIIIIIILFFHDDLYCCVKHANVDVDIFNT